MKRPDRFAALRLIGGAPSVALARRVELRFVAAGLREHATQLRQQAEAAESEAAALEAEANRTPR